MSEIHRFIAYAIVGGFGVLFLWGLVALVAKRDPTGWWWRLLAGLQAGLGLQLVAGVVLLLFGRRLPSLLHLFYGSLFPVGVLVVAHVLGRGMDHERDTVRVFVIASFFVFGLTLRALTTGLGLP